MRGVIAPEESEELRQLWRVYEAATYRVLEIMRTQGSDGLALPQILEEDGKAGRAIKRIKEIHGGR